MNTGDRVRLSDFGKNYLDWPIVADGTITAPGISNYDYLVQWDDDQEGNTIAHFENELEVLS